MRWRQKGTVNKCELTSYCEPECQWLGLVHSRQSLVNSLIDIVHKHPQQALHVLVLLTLRADILWSYLVFSGWRKCTPTTLVIPMFQ